MSQRLRHERAAIHQKSKWRLAGYIIAGILGAVLLLGVIGLLLILHTTPPPVVHTDPVAAQRLQQELQKAQTAAAGGGTPGVVRADETELNSVLKEYLNAATAKASADGVGVVRDMKVNLAADRLHLYVLVNYRGKDLTFVLEGKVRTINGYLDFEPISGKIGSLSIPKGPLKRAVEQMAATPETQKLMRLPKNLRDLHVENGQLVVVFR
jgi:hypothetical protein